MEREAEQIIKNAFDRALQLQLRLGTFPPLSSIQAQLDYLRGLVRHEHRDFSRLKDIILGIYAAREFETIDLEFAEMLYRVEVVVDSLKKLAEI